MTNDDKLYGKVQLLDNALQIAHMLLHQVLGIGMVGKSMPAQIGHDEPVALAQRRH